MIGDSIAADVKVPENAGIKGVLVRNKNEAGIRYYSNNLFGLSEIIK